MWLGLPAVVLVFAALLVSTFEKRALLSTDGVIVISNARVSLVADGARQSELVRLPYHWDSHHPGAQGSAVFDVKFELAEAPSEPWGLQFPKIGNAYEVRLNGLLLERRGDLDAYNGADYALLPRYVPLGAQLQPGINHLTIAVRADRGRDAGLSRIIAGPTRTIRPDLERRYNWLFVSTAANAAFSLGVGLLALGFWRSRATAISGKQGRDRMLYLYAGLAELTGAAAVGASLVGLPPVPWPWWGAVWNTTLGASISLITLSCVEMAGWGDRPSARRLRRWLAALVLACPAMSYGAFGFGAIWALTLWYLTLGISVAGFAGFFLTRAIRGATLEHRLVAIAIVVNLGAGLHDFYAFRSAIDYLHINMLVYSSILFDLTLGAIMILRFRGANEQVRELIQTQAARLTERERELGASYRQLEQLARQQERMKERASILRDMHDGVGAHLSMALRQIESGRLTKEELLPPLRDALDQLKLTIDNVNLPAGDVASLMGNLRYRLGPRIESSGMRLDWRVDALAPLDGVDGLAMRQLMFILFEAISNALQHSRATELRVEAAETDGGIRVRVIDNGVGFDVASSWERSLLTMKSRAERIGAQLDIRSAAGGTTVEVVIPREPATG
jgi:signal transduction histidine kinase